MFTHSLQGGKIPVENFTVYLWDNNDVSVR